MNRILVSQDDDMLRIATQRLREGVPLSGVIYAHQRTAIILCIEDLHLISEAEIEEDYLNFVRYLPL